MKNNTILIVSFFFAVALLIVPNINAVQYKTMESSIEEQTNQIMNTNLERLQSLGFGNGVFKKVLTIFLFGIETVLAFGYWLASPIAINIFEPYLDSLISNSPVLAFVFMFIFVLGIPFLALQPMDVIFNLIKRIGAWDEDILIKIESVIVFSVGAIIYLLEYFEIIDLFSDSGSEKQSIKSYLL
jgi:hypothetical protein